MAINYSKNEINRAGSKIAKNGIVDDAHSLRLLNFWRMKHEHPLQVFRVRLTRLSKIIDPDSNTGYRLKKRATIIDKLKRFKNMKLTTMQDLAGCRIVLGDVSFIKNMSDKISKRTSHVKIRERDYIAIPKDDGYRSLHLIYEYKSKQKKDYDGLFVEIQLRTRLQHVWATAVETVDLFTKQSMKTNRGDAKWSKFFKFVSSAFAMIEHTALVPNTPTDKKILYSEIKQLEHELDALNLMREWSKSIKEMNSSNISAHTYLLVLNFDSLTIKISTYTDKQIEKALDDYMDAESISNHNAVLVKAEKVNEIKKMYPNYFANTKKFISEIKKIIK